MTFRWMRQLRGWWQRRRLAARLIQQLEQGSGVTTATWAPGTSSETVLAWFDDQVAAMRTPYGLSGVKLAVLGEPGPPRYEMLLTRRAEWAGERRSELMQVLEPLLAATSVTTAVISFGTALHALFSDQAEG